MLLLNPGELLANKRRGLRIRGLAPVGEIFCTLSLSPHSISSVAPPCAFLHVTWCRTKRNRNVGTALIFSDFSAYWD